MRHAQPVLVKTLINVYLHSIATKEFICFALNCDLLRVRATSLFFFVSSPVPSCMVRPLRMTVLLLSVHPLLYQGLLHLHPTYAHD